MRSTVLPRLMIWASDEKSLINTGAKVNKSPPETTINPISNGMIALASPLSFLLSLAPNAFPAKVAAAVCIPQPGI